jgi:hypothetical protein
MPHAGLRFGIFLAPFHRLGDNPTLALARDLELSSGSTSWATTKPGSASTTPQAGKPSPRPR